MKTAPKKRRRSPALARLALLNVVFLLAISIVGVAVAEKTAWGTVLTYLPQSLFVVPGALILLGLLIRRNFLAFFLFGLPTAVIAWFLLGIHIPTRREVAQPKDLTILTYNIHHAEGGWANVKSIIEAQKPDIVCIQEADKTGASGEYVTEAIEGYQSIRRSALTVYSRQPITEAKTVELAKGSSDGLLVKAFGMNVVCVHLASFPDDTWKPGNLRKYPRIFKQVARQHRTEVESLLRELPDDEPVVVCGDGNMPPRGQVYTLLRSRFLDAFNSVGTGTGYTFPSAFPIERIDYVFLSNVRPVDAQVLSTQASDHRPLLVKVRPQG